MCLQQPIRNYAFPLVSLVNWFTEELILTKRESLRQLVLSLQRRLNPDLQYDPKQDGMEITSVPSCSTESIDSDKSASIPLIALETESTYDTVLSDSNGKEAASGIDLMSTPVYESKPGMVVADVTSNTVTAWNESISVMVVDTMSSGATPVCYDSTSVMVAELMFPDSGPVCDESTSVMVVDPISSETTPVCDGSVSVIVAEPMLSDSGHICNELTSVMVAVPMSPASEPVCDELTSVMVAVPMSPDSEPVCDESTSVVVAVPMSPDSGPVCDESTSVVVAVPMMSPESGPVCDALTYAIVAEQVSVNNFPSSLVFCEPSVTISAPSMSVCHLVNLCSEKSIDAKQTMSSEADTVADIDAFGSVLSSDVSEMKTDETGTNYVIGPDISNHSVVQETNDLATIVNNATMSSAVFSMTECVDNEFAEQTSVTLSLGGVNIPLEPLSDGHNVTSVLKTPPSHLLLQQLNLSSDSIRLGSEAVKEAVCFEEISTVLPNELDSRSLTFVESDKEPISVTLGDPFNYAVSESKHSILDAVNMNCVTSTSLLVVNHVDCLSKDVHNEQSMDAEDVSYR